MGLPANRDNKDALYALKLLYSKLSMYDVLSSDPANNYFSIIGGKRTQFSFYAVSFATKEDTQEVCQLYDKVTMLGEYVGCQ